MCVCVCRWVSLAKCQGIGKAMVWFPVWPLWWCCCFSKRILTLLQSIKLCKWGTMLPLKRNVSICLPKKIGILRGVACALLERIHLYNTHKLNRCHVPLIYFTKGFGTYWGMIIVKVQNLVIYGSIYVLTLDSTSEDSPSIFSRFLQILRWMSKIVNGSMCIAWYVWYVYSVVGLQS